MSVQTEEDLSRYIQKDLGWRRKEIHHYHLLVVSADESKAKILVRGAVVMLYAHWEGFVKRVGECYWSYVRIRKLTYGELASNFTAIAIQRKLDTAVIPRSVLAHVEVVDLLRGDMKERAHLSKSEIVNTKSNLGAEVLRDIVCALGIEYRSDYAAAEKPVIDRLLHLRNNIAHGGEYEHIAIDEYRQLYETIDKLMCLFSNQVQNAAVERRYRRAEHSGAL